MTGGWVKNYPDDVKAILAAGHDLGNHSENHKNMSQLSAAEQEKELMDVHNRVKELTGYDMFLFRPPYGDYDNSVILTAKKCGYFPIQWDVDSLVIKQSSKIYIISIPETWLRDVLFPLYIVMFSICSNILLMHFGVLNALSN